MNERFKVVYSDEALDFINSLPQKAKAEAMRKEYFNDKKQEKK